MIEEIPTLQADWDRKRVSDVLKLHNGYPFKPTDWTSSGRPIIRIQNLKSETAPYNHYEGELPDRFKARPGDLLFAWSGTPGTSFGAHVWEGPEAWVNQHIFRVDFSDSDFNRDFLKLALNYNLVDYIAQAQGGVGLAHITKAKLDQSFLIHPPLSIQRSIADLIAEYEELRDRAADHLKTAQRSVQRFRHAVLAAACSGRLTAGWRVGQAEDASESLPASWRSMHLAEVIESSFYGPRFSSDVYVSDGIPTIRTTDMNDRGKIEFRDPPKLELNPYELEKLRLRDGDLLVTRTGATIGKCAIYEDRLGPALPSAYLIRFRLQKDHVLPNFILLFLLSPLGQAALRQAATATAQPNVNAKSIAQIPLVLPPINEQHEIVRRASNLLATEDALLARIDDASKAVEHSSQAVLAKAFRGELLSPPEVLLSA